MQYPSRAFSLGAFALCTGAFLLSSCGPKEPGSPNSEKALPKVGIVVVKPAPYVQYSTLQGRTAAYMVSEVRPQVSGIVKRRLFKEGSLIKAGQSLYQIDPATYQASYDSAKASLEKAQANLSSIEVKAKRYENLIKIHAISQQDFDDNQAALKTAHADVSASKASLEMARINLAYTQVRAPIGGRIGQSAVTPGALVQKDQPAPLVTIQQLNPMYVDLTQTTSELLKLKRELAAGKLKESASVAAKVKLTLEDGSTYTHEGKLEFSDVTVDPGTGSVNLRAVFPNPKELLLPGMYVKAYVEAGTVDKAILVPQQAISRDNTGAAIALVLDEHNVVQQVRVKAEEAVGNQWLIDSGLKAGDRVIVRGSQFVRPGQKAQLLENTSAEPTAKQ